MKIIRRISLSVLIILFLSIAICYGQNVVKESYTKGLEFASQGKFKEAKEEFEKALNVDPNYESAKRTLNIIEDTLYQKIKSRTAIHLFKGIAYGKKELWGESIGEINRAVEFNPKYAYAYYYRGKAYYNLDKYHQAIEDYDEAIRLDSDYSNAYIRRGAVYYILGKYKRAIEDYDEAIRIDPENQIAQDERYFARNILERQARSREKQAFLWLWQVCFGIAFFSGLLKGRKVFGFLLGITGPLGAIVVLCTPSAIKRCIACKNTIPEKAVKCPHCQTDQPEKLILEKELPVKTKVIKWILLLVPIFLWLLTGGSCIYKQYRTFPLVKEANGLIWGDNSDPLIVRVEYKLLGEKHHYRILVEKSDGILAHESEMVVDNDKWDWGFVKAVNVDDDAGLEIVAWDTYEESKSFYLDYFDGIVQQKSFSQVSIEMKAFARELLNAQLTKEISLLLLFPLIVYYILFGIVLLALRLWRRRRSKTLTYKEQNS